MTTFLFLGDMLVMLFMIATVVWVSLVESGDRIDYTAAIPLNDETSEGAGHG
mgnify:CR=1 FL=1